MIVGGLALLENSEGPIESPEQTDLYAQLDRAVAAGDAQKAEQLGRQLSLRAEDLQSIGSGSPEAHAAKAAELLKAL